MLIDRLGGRGRLSSRILERIILIGRLGISGRVEFLFLLPPLSLLRRCLPVFFFFSSLTGEFTCLVIQGTADVSKLSQEELSKTLEFCAQAFEPSTPEERARVLEKLKIEDISLSSAPVPAPAGNSSCDDIYGDVNDSGIDIDIGPELATKPKTKTKTNLDLDMNLNEEEQRVLNHIRARKMMRTEDILHIESFSTDVIDGFAVRFERGRLGLRRVCQDEGQDEGEGA